MGNERIKAEIKEVIDELVHEVGSLEINLKNYTSEFDIHVAKALIEYQTKTLKKLQRIIGY